MIIKKGNKIAGFHFHAIKIELDIKIAQRIKSKISKNDQRLIPKNPCEHSFYFNFSYAR